MHKNVNCVLDRKRCSSATGSLLLIVWPRCRPSAIRYEKLLGKIALLTILLPAAGYTVILLVYSFASSEKVPARGVEKHSAKFVSPPRLLRH